MRARFLVLALLPAVCFAGESLVLTPSVQNTSINLPNFSSNQSWRVEFQIHNFVLPAAGNFGAGLLSLTGIGLQAWIYPTNAVAVQDSRDTTSSGGAPCQLDLTGRTNVLVRITRNVPSMLFTCEIWNYDGTGYLTQSQTILSLNSWPFSGGNLGGASNGGPRVFACLHHLDSHRQ